MQKHLFCLLILVAQTVASDPIAILQATAEGMVVSNMQFPVQTDWRLQTACQVSMVSGVPVFEASCLSGAVGFSFEGFSPDLNYSMEFSLIRTGEPGLVLLAYQSRTPGFTHYFRTFSTASARNSLTTLTVGLQGLNPAKEGDSLIIFDNPVYSRDWEDRRGHIGWDHMPVEWSLLDSALSPVRIHEQQGLWIHSITIKLVETAQRTEVLKRMQERLTFWFDRQDVQPWIHGFAFIVLLLLLIYSRYSLSMRLSLCLGPVAIVFLGLQTDESMAQRALRLLNTSERELGELMESVLDEDSAVYKQRARTYLKTVTREVQEAVTDESLKEVEAILGSVQESWKEAGTDYTLLGKILRQNLNRQKEVMPEVFSDWPSIRKMLLKKKPMDKNWRLVSEEQLNHHRNDVLGPPVSITQVGRVLRRARVLKGVDVNLSNGVLSTDGFSAHFGFRSNMAVQSMLGQRLAKEIEFTRMTTPDEMKQGDINLEFRDQAKTSGFGTEFLHHYLDRRLELIPFSLSDFGQMMARFAWDYFKTTSGQRVILQLRADKGLLIRWIYEDLVNRAPKGSVLLLAGEHTAVEIPHLNAPLMPEAQQAQLFLSRQTRLQTVLVQGQNQDYLFAGGRFIALGGYTLALGVPLMQLCDQASRDRLFNLGLLGFGLLMVGFLVHAAVRGVLNPLKQMELGLQNMMGQTHRQTELQVMSEDELSWLARSFLQMMKTLAEKESIVGFLARRAKQAIESNRPTIRTRLSIFFVGLTDPSILNPIGIQKQIEVLDLILNPLQTHLTEEGLWIDKFTGSAILAVLPWDRPLPDFLTRMQRLLDCMRAVEEDLHKQGIGIQLSLGVATGFAVCGHIGADRRKDYTVVGDVVNLASRCRDYASKKGSSAVACVDEVTALDLGLSPEFVASHEQRIQVRGRQGAVRVILMDPDSLRSRL